MPTGNGCGIPRQAVSTNPEDPLAQWPAERAVGLLVFTHDSPSLATLEAWAREQVTINECWSATATNLLVGPTVEPPFAGVHLVELANADAARRFVDDIARLESPSTTVVAASPIPPKDMRRLKRFQFYLRMFPNPGASGGALPASYVGGVVPNPEQLLRLQVLPQDAPVLVFNLDRYQAKATDPKTGESKTGAEVFEPYFRRGLTTFSRLGARVLWKGQYRGRISGELEMPEWHDIRATWYPSLAAFRRLGQNPGFQSKIAYRIAGLEASWVVMGQVSASSVANDVSPAQTSR